MNAPNSSSLSPERLRDLLEEILTLARSGGASEAEASLGASDGLSVTARKGDIETLERTEDRGLTVTVYRGRRKGSASTSDLRSAAVRETVSAALDIARYADEDPFAGLAEPELMAYDYPDLDLDHPWDIDIEEATRIAIETERAALAYDPRVKQSDGASVSSGRSHRFYGNSHGFVGDYPATRHGSSAIVLAEQDGAMQRDHWYTSSRDARELDPPEAVGFRAAERAVRRLGARKVATEIVPVLFAPEAARSLVGHFLAAISGGSLYRRASFLVGALGQPVFSSGISISEFPRRSGGAYGAPFDLEGVATADRCLVRDGVLESYVLSAYSARKLDLRPTGNAGGVRNVTVTGEARPLETLLSEMGRGFYVHELIGMGVNVVTGDYSRGASGFWVEEGVISHPVEEVTIAGNLRQMLASILAVGEDVDRRGNIQTGSVLVEAMTLAGN